MGLAALASLLVAADDPLAPLVEIRIDNATVFFETDAGARFSIDVIRECGQPAVGAPEIRATRVTPEALTATYGKHSAAIISIQTGEVQCASD